MYPSYLFPVTGLSGQTLSANSSTSINFSVFPTAKYVEISISSQPVLITFDGSVPTTTNGLIYPVNQPSFVWSIDKALSAKFKTVSGTAIIYGVGMVDYKAESTYIRSISSELIGLSSYPVNPGF